MGELCALDFDGILCDSWRESSLPKVPSFPLSLLPTKCKRELHKGGKSTVFDHYQSKQILGFFFFHFNVSKVLIFFIFLSCGNSLVCSKIKLIISFVWQFLLGCQSEMAWFFWWVDSATQAWTVDHMHPLNNLRLIFNLVWVVLDFILIWFWISGSMIYRSKK